MRQFLEGSQAVAESVKLCRPGVISAYPITPQTHIVEGLAQMVADGDLKAQFINVESEHSAASLVLGASATGARAFTATSSQGLLLMAEVLFNIAGMRLPLVLTCANRSVSAPINIWNDHQDAVTVRDSGWIQFWAEDIQDVIDLHIQAYRLSEDSRVYLPVMVNMDGYILTHGLEVADLPSQKDVDKFLPAYNPSYKLDVENPMTLGFLATPDYYMETRFAIAKTLSDTLEIIPEIAKGFKKVFGRESGGLLQAYRCEDAEVVLVAKGSLIGTIKDTVDDLRAEGKKVGVLKLITYRPFPAKAICDCLAKIPNIGVVEKSISLGATGPLYADITSVLPKETKRNIGGFVIGLGGRDIKKRDIREIFDRLIESPNPCQFIGIKGDLLKEDSKNE
ncbi:MAG: pyruvate ferredoxin oxidoreductase [Candidatus Omnitrophica bacterium]|nr:pyruvate ferredoxin oxidoreductase [Candidatus Omnitrophota bacterium]